MIPKEKVEKVTNHIKRLFASRNQISVEGLMTSWLEDLLYKYNYPDIERAFTHYRLYGDDFPSLPKIIKLIEKSPEKASRAATAWVHVLQSADKGSSAGLDHNIKKILKMVTLNGLTDVIEADNFTQGKIEREFKTVYKDALEGVPIAGSENKELDNG